MADTTSFQVSEDDPIERVLSWVTGCYAQGGMIENLLILCHGFENPGLGLGGHGLQFSKDGIFQSNINTWSMIKGQVNWLFLYACGTAGVDPTAPANKGNGQALCRMMANNTGARVVAATRTQYYYKVTAGLRRRAFDRSLAPFDRNEIDFGEFEGPVHMFLPDGTVTNLAPWFGQF